jgi:predicted RNase H-like HicB family nuclease
MKATVTFTVSFPIDVREEATYHVASCPVLDVWAHGKTRQAAMDDLKDTLQLFLSHCFEHGTLESVLKGCGPTVHELDVTLPFVVNQPLSN